jgi:hypothetical protein
MGFMLKGIVSVYLKGQCLEIFKGIVSVYLEG